ncbi:MAG: amidohydrolase [Methanomethylovorans sp.]|uniref:M20 metallopeptidase family protein n=1 Tax=Methanomethylovorans sp. TaxID=2758717 RepID=UPI0034585A6C
MICLLPLEQWIIQKRREFHKYPELSFNEHMTQKRIINSLKEFDLESSPIADTGVIADITGSGPGPCIAIRSDTDALPIQEERTAYNSEYISCHNGVMHACGHDGHMAIVLGVARMLFEKRHEFPGKVRLIFQPAEEQYPGGAKKVIDDGGLAGVDAIIGLHIFGDIDVGDVRFCPGPLMANSNDFSIRIKGKGGHVSTPEHCINPLEMAADLISRSRLESAMKVDPSRHVFGFGMVTGGARTNIIPDDVHISGSYRTFDEMDTVTIRNVLDTILISIMEKYAREDIVGVPSYELDVVHGYPVLVNDPVFTSAASKLLKQLFTKVDDNASPIFGSEDFAYYLRQIPGMFLFLGTYDPKKDIIESNHSSSFDIDESILMQGVQILCSIALDFLNKPGEYIH